MKEDSNVIKIVRIVYMPVLYQFAGILTSWIAIFIISAYMGKKYSDPARAIAETLSIYNKNAILITGISAVIIIPFCIFVYQRDKKKKRQQNYYISYQKPAFWHIFLIVVLGASVCIALNNLIYFSGLVSLFPGFQEVAESIYSGNLLTEIITIVFLAPIVEELLFRGIAYKRMYEYWGYKRAAILSALFFGVYHLNVVQGVYAFLLGILLTYVYEKFHTIKAPILLHMAANAVSVLGTELTIFQETNNSWILQIAITAITTIAACGSFWLIKKRVLLEEQSRE